MLGRCLDGESGLVRAARTLALFDRVGGISNILHVRDSFTDSDGTDLTVHTMDVGAGWTALAGTWTIQSNQAKNDGNGSVSLGVAADAGRTDVLVRLEGTVLVIFERVGTFTSRATTNFTATVGQTYVLEVAVVGTSVTVSVDGTPLLSYGTMASGLTAMKCGLYGGQSTDRYDNFQVTSP